MINILTFFLLQAFAAPNTPALQARIQLGEKLTEISITPKGKAYQIQMGAQRHKGLNAADFKTIREAFDKLPSTAKLPPECSRAYMEVAMKAAAKQSCFGVASINTAEFIKFSNLLLLAL